MTKEQIYIRESILNQSKPFCLSDILTRINGNKSIILNELNKMYEQGLVKHKLFDGIYAFYVVK